VENVTNRKKLGDSAAQWVVGQAAPPREKTVEVSASDADVILESNPPATQTGLALDARKVAASAPTDPGVLRQRLKRRKSVVLAVAGGLGVVALGLTVRGFVHRTSASASTSPAASATPVPATPESASAPPPAPSASEAVVSTADSTPQSNDEPPAASASAKPPAPRTRPARPRHPPSKVTR
jgi:hypothetical protein